MRCNIFPTTFQPENGCIGARLLTGAGRPAEPQTEHRAVVRKGALFLTRAHPEAVGAIAGGWPPIRVSVINDGRACRPFTAVSPLGGGAQSGADICSA